MSWQIRELPKCSVLYCLYGDYYSTHKTNGQLIFSTHLTKFLNQQELVRLDEVWNIAKKEGNSYMYSFNEYNIHNTINIENGYLDGRYGYTPSKYLNI